MYTRTKEEVQEDNTLEHKACTILVATLIIICVVAFGGSILGY